MSRPVLIGVVVAAVLVAGGAAYMLTRDEDSDNQQQSSQDSTNSGSSAFSPASTEGLEFTATISVDGSETATLEHDDQNNSRYVTTIGGQQTEIIYTSDAYYTCQSGGNCIKFPLSQSSNSGFNPSDYTYDENKLSSYASPAYKGQGSCESGTCDVWEVSAGGVTSTLYVDTNTKRITKVQGTVNGKTSTIVYDYKDVTITVPANAQTITTPTP